MEAFQQEYLKKKNPFELKFVNFRDEEADDETYVSLDFVYRGEAIHSEAQGNGPIDAVKLAIKQCVNTVDFTVMNYDEHALSEGSGAKAAAYIQMRDNRTGNVTFGVGVSSNITRASIRGMFSALNRLAEMAQ
jgi:2-isopropylmalate synthase